MAHSLGGLVIKQVSDQLLVLYEPSPEFVLSQALIVGKNRADMRYENLLDSVRAVMFFGTPHQGGNGVNAATFVANILQAVNVDARKDLIKELNPDSLFLFDLTGDFRQVIEALGIVIYTFYEGKKTKIGAWPMKHNLLVSGIDMSPGHVRV